MISKSLAHVAARTHTRIRTYTHTQRLPQPLTPTLLLILPWCRGNLMIAINPAEVEAGSADPRDSCKLPRVNYWAAYTFNKPFSICLSPLRTPCHVKDDGWKKRGRWRGKVKKKKSGWGYLAERGEKSSMLHGVYLQLRTHYWCSHKWMTQM